MAQWVIVILAICAIIFNTGITYGHIQHLRKDVADIKRELEELRNYIMEKL